MAASTRPTRYTKALGDRICKQIRNGRTLNDICKQADMPHRSRIYIWFNMPSLKTFQDNYAAAVVARTDAWAEEIVEIADTPKEGEVFERIESETHGVTTKSTHKDMLGHRKLQISARMQLMAKINPTKYGDKIDVTSGGEEIKPILLYDMSPAAMAARHKLKSKETVNGKKDKRNKK